MPGEAASTPGNFFHALKISSADGQVQDPVGSCQPNVNSIESAMIFAIVAVRPLVRTDTVADSGFGYTVINVRVTVTTPDLLSNRLSEGLIGAIPALASPSTQVTQALSAISMLSWGLDFDVHRSSDDEPPGTMREKVQVVGI